MSAVLETVTESAKDGIRWVIDLLVRVLTPVINFVRKIPGVDKLLGNVAVNGPRYGAVAAAIIAKFVQDTWGVDIAHITIPVVDWSVSLTAILSVLIAFAIGYAIQRVLTLPRVNPDAFAPPPLVDEAPPVDFDATIAQVDEDSDKADPSVPAEWIELSEAVEALDAGFPPEEDQD